MKTRILRWSGVTAAALSSVWVVLLAALVVRCKWGVQPFPALAKALAVDATRLNDIVRGRRGITADTALRLSRYLGTSAKFWLNLHSDYDLRVARQAKQKEIERAIRPRPEAVA